MKNFSERISKCFNKEPWTQTYEASVSLNIDEHPEMDPKSHRADELLPDSLVSDCLSVGMSAGKTGFIDVDNKDQGYTILEFNVEREPIDRYEERIKFITDKLVEYGFKEDRIHITKWD